MAGPIRRELDKELAALMTAHPFGDTLAQSARMVADRLDLDVLSRDLAPVHRELRDTLAELAKYREAGRDEFADGLSTPVRNPS